MRWRHWALLLGCLHVCTADKKTDAEAIADEAVRSFGLDPSARDALVSGASQLPDNTKIRPHTLSATQALFVAMSASLVHTASVPSIVERLVNIHGANPADMTTPRMSPACHLIRWSLVSAIDGITESMSRCQSLPDWKYPGPVLQTLATSGQLVPLSYLFAGSIAVAAEDLGLRIDNPSAPAIVGTLAGYAMEDALLLALRLPWLSHRQIETYENELRFRNWSYVRRDKIPSIVVHLAKKLAVSDTDTDDFTSTPTGTKSSSNILDNVVLTNGTLDHSSARSAGNSGAGASGFANLDTGASSIITNPTTTTLNKAKRAPASAHNNFTGFIGPVTQLEWAIASVTADRRRNIATLELYGADMAEIKDAASFARVVAKSIGTKITVPEDLQLVISDVVQCVRPGDLKSPLMAALYEEAARARCLSFVECAYNEHINTASMSGHLAAFHMARSNAFSMLLQWATKIHLSTTSPLSLWTDADLGRYTAQRWMLNAMHGLDLDTSGATKDWVLLFKVLRDSTSNMRLAFSSFNYKCSSVLYNYVLAELGLATSDPEAEMASLAAAIQFHLETTLDSVVAVAMPRGISEFVKLLATHFTLRCGYFLKAIVENEHKNVLSLLAVGYKKMAQQSVLQAYLLPYITSDTPMALMQILIKAGVAPLPVPTPPEAPSNHGQTSASTIYSVPPAAANYFRIAGIVIAVILGVIILLAALSGLFWLRVRRRPQNYE